MQLVKTVTHTNTGGVLIFVGILAIATLIFGDGSQIMAQDKSTANVTTAQVDPAESALNSALGGLKALQTNLVAKPEQPAVEQAPPGKLPFKDMLVSNYVQSAGVLTRCSSIDTNLNYQGDPTETALWNGFDAQIKQWYFDDCMNSFKAHYATK